MGPGFRERFIFWQKYWKPRSPSHNSLTLRFNDFESIERACSSSLTHQSTSGQNVAADFFSLGFQTLIESAHEGGGDLEDSPRCLQRAAHDDFERLAIYILLLRIESPQFPLCTQVRLR